MKIAIIIDNYSTGGVALALKEFLKALENEPFEITVFIRNIENANLDATLKNVSYKKWSRKKEDICRSPELIKNQIRKLLSWRNLGRKIIYEARCYENLSGEYDCAIGYQMISNDVTIMTLEKINAKRKLLWLHGKKNFLDKDLKFYDDIYSKADTIVCVAKETENRFKKLMPKSAEKTCTIHNFYDINAINRKAKEQVEIPVIEEDELMIVSVGRLSKEKGFDRVPTVAQLLRTDGYKFKWLIVGHGDQYQSLQQEIIKYNLEENVQFIGYRENPYPYIKNCDIYVQPSYTEGYCTSTMEAKILGKIVVATDVSGMREQFVDGETGIIVESSAEGIYGGIKKIFDEIELRNVLSSNLNLEPITNIETMEKTIEVIRGK